jgi:hypothetical protein
MATRPHKKRAEDAEREVVAEHQSPVLRGQSPIPLEELQPFDVAKLINTSMKATISNLRREVGTDGKELCSMTVTVTLSADGMDDVPPEFDPWTTTGQEAQTRGGDLNSPEMRAWLVAQTINSERHNIERDGMALLSAVSRVMHYRLRTPRWLSTAYARRLRPFEELEVGSLDEVFEHQPTTERKRRAMARRKKLIALVHEALLDAIRAEPRRPIDVALFEEVGARFDIGKTQCRLLYEAAVRDEGMQDLVDFKRFVPGIMPSSGETA